MNSNSNSQEMADAAFTLETVCNSMTKRNVTSAPIDVAMRWCKEDFAEKNNTDLPTTHIVKSIVSRFLKFIKVIK
jgi:transcriptional regulator NrdR family protein